MAYQQRFKELIALVLDDAASEKELDELVALARENDQNLQTLKDHLVVSDRLSQYEDLRRTEEKYLESLQTRIAAEDNSTDFIRSVLKASHEPKSVPPVERTRATDWRPWVLAIAAIPATVLIAVFSFTFDKMPDSARDVSPISVAPKSQELHDPGVALLTRIVGIRGAETVSWKEGETVSPKRLNWDSGLIQLEFYSGATVVAEGPASVEIVDAKNLYLHYGKLRANIPKPAQGFTILAPTLELVDLGTEFGMAVGDDGSVDVQVFDGKVELYEPKSSRNEETRRELTKGKAISITAEGLSEPVDTSQLSFVSSHELASLTTSHSIERYEKWQEHRDVVISDPRIAAYFPFERDPANDRTLLGYGAEGEIIQGAIVGAKWATGRWPDKSSLEFKRPGDRVRLNIPGSYLSMTFSAWVRLDGLDRRFSSLLLTDEFNNNMPHWQIHQEGHLLLGMWIEGASDTAHYRSPNVFSLQDVGQWAHVATVYDSVDSRVRHFLNGELISNQSIDNAARGDLTLEFATIGNWSPANETGWQKIRNLNGRIDEMTIYGVPLTEEQVGELFQKGRP